VPLVLLAFALFSFGATTGAGSKAAPTLRLVSTKPFVVSGRHFHPRQRLRVSVSFRGSRLARKTTSSATGAFRVFFGSLPYDRCRDALLLSARGPDDRLTVKLPPPECPPA
jgi:hypothetical protein